MSWARVSDGVAVAAERAVEGQFLVFWRRSKG